MGSLQPTAVLPMKQQQQPMMGMQQPMGVPMGAMGMNASPYMGTMNQQPAPRGQPMNIGMMQSQQQSGNRAGFDPFGNLGSNLGQPRPNRR